MEDRLVLTIDSETPPPADEVGELLAALARDYREMTRGRVLVVSRVDNGSIIATLTDAALATAPYVAGGLVMVAAVNSLAKFAENLQKWFGYAKSDHEQKRLYRKGKKAPGQRSVEAIVKAAAKTGGHIRVKHTSAKGETIEAELTSTEALNALQTVKAKQETSSDEAKAVRVERMGHLMIRSPEVRGAIERLKQAGTENLSSPEIQTVIDVVVAVLQAAGAGHLLPEIASELERHGLLDFAHEVQRHIRSTSGKHEPPLTTT